MSSIARLAVAVAFVLTGACAALADDDTKPNDPNPPASVKIEVSRGDRWTYEVRDDVTDELKTIIDIAVTDVTDSEIDTRVGFTNASTNAESTAVQVFDPHWRLKDNGAFVYRPALEHFGIPPDIQVGKTWSYSYELSRINPPGNFKYAGKAKVVSWERVSVRNGLAYDAFKIEFNTAATPVVNNRKFEEHILQWYAPAANRYVKFVYESRQNGKLLESSVQTLRDYRRRE
ncbi:MAG: hypothetical protein ABSF67_16305 [Roseiarcus sp.]|jgi:hypothetical protein